MAIYDYAITNDIWSTWTSDTYTNSGTNTIEYDAGCTSQTVWYSWVVNANETYANHQTIKYNSCGTWILWVSEEDTKRQERAERKQQAPRRFAGGLTDQEKIDLRTKKAETRAKDLLLDLIGEDQLKIYEETGRLFVKGYKYDYVIKRDKVIGGLERIEKDKITDLCVHLASKFKCPKTDNVIALKLAIESDEDNILRLANKQREHKRPAQLKKAACI